jgi:glycosyltransferase involved in cell wall biosynthesis
MLLPAFSIVIWYIGEYVLLTRSSMIDVMGKEYIVKSYRVPHKKVRVSRLGTADHGLGATNRESESIHLVSCSRVIPLKRVELIARTINLLDERFIWTHIGDGQSHEIVQKYINDHHLQDRTNLLGWIPSDQVSNVYKQFAFDFFIHVSETEGIPVSIMEAMSFGLPVLATDVGGIHELVDDTNGCLIPKDIDEVMLGKYVSEFVKNDLKKMGENAREKFLQKSNISKCNQNLLGILLNESA